MDSNSWWLNEWMNWIHVRLSGLLTNIFHFWPNSLIFFLLKFTPIWTIWCFEYKLKVNGNNGPVFTDSSINRNDLLWLIIEIPFLETPMSVPADQLRGVLLAPGPSQQENPGLGSQFSTLIGRAPARLGSHWLVWIMMLLPQLSSAMKTRLKAPIGRYFLPCQPMCLYGIRVASI